MFLAHTAAPIPRKRPLGPSFLNMTLTPWKTPLYNRGASTFDCSSPCSCSLCNAQISTLIFPDGAANSYRILTVSKGCVTVTAPQAATPPARKALATVSRQCPAIVCESANLPKSSSHLFRAGVVWVLHVTWRMVDLKTFSNVIATHFVPAFRFQIQNALMSAY